MQSDLGAVERYELEWEERNDKSIFVENEFPSHS